MHLHGAKGLLYPDDQTYGNLTNTSSIRNCRLAIKPFAIQFIFDFGFAICDLGTETQGSSNCKLEIANWKFTI